MILGHVYDIWFLFVEGAENNGLHPIALQTANPKIVL